MTRTAGSDFFQWVRGRGLNEVKLVVEDKYLYANRQYKYICRIFLTKFCDIHCCFLNTPPETVPLDRTNGAPRPLKWCVVTASMVH